jgi:hypothetical protein
MVHALNNARRALADTGLLVDIHPAPDPRTISCATREGPRAVGIVRGSRAKVRAAERKLDLVRRSGVFRLHHSEVFHVLHYVASLRTLRAYVERNFPGKWVDTTTERRIMSLLGRRAVGTIIIDEPVRISLLGKPRSTTVSALP